MFRVFLFIAVVALSTGAPYGDVNSQRSLLSSSQSQTWSQPAPQIAKLPQQDETELVDSLGGGYSFFKKQPIVARPLIQQKMAIKEQQAPITSFDDTSNQWSDYTKASAFKTLPKVHVVSSNKDLLMKDQSSYGSALPQQQIPVDTSAQFGQQDLTQSWSSKPALLPQPSLIRDEAVSGYGQQQDLPKSWAPKSVILPQPSLIRDEAVSGYGQQQDVPKSWAPKPVILSEQPFIRDEAVSGYGQQQDLQSWSSKPVARPQQTVQTLPQQSLIRDEVVSGYGQQQDLQQQWTPKSNIGFAHQSVRTLAQQQPLVRPEVSSFSQQNLQQQWTPKSNFVSSQNWEDKLSGPVVNTIPSSQSSWSTQQDFSPMIASRSAFQSAPVKQSSDSGSFAGW